jgi:hypothetical protein
LIYTVNSDILFSEVKQTTYYPTKERLRMTTITRIRKEVATLANRINRKLNDLSAAFRRAWQIVKGHELVSKISGVTYGTRQRALRKLSRYNPGIVNAMLGRDAENKYDANAVKVLVSVGDGAKYDLGFIPRELAALIAPLLDAGVELAARFRGVTGGYESRETYGALIAIEM